MHALQSQELGNEDSHFSYPAVRRVQDKLAQSQTRLQVSNGLFILVRLHSHLPQGKINIRQLEPVLVISFPKGQRESHQWTPV